MLTAFPTTHMMVAMILIAVAVKVAGARIVTYWINETWKVLDEKDEAIRVKNIVFFV